ncbi:hypothetical protein D1816_17300 [Aquimarina sp. AD10]|uniref:hypothetical protein n=1 Tax=Aquimarina sp. AD10 TaxID=1714849 RepID=UPI000E4D6D5A|nr:hypothetical protein [Aquimarina sp. AD10]AXT62040.1 hypothetical protein D1816_17300 [Aquimarina sp. AD10]RKM99972.1 hypothetical protein D7033_10280 [Aquimarina sp. AD10]
MNFFRKDIEQENRKRLRQLLDKVKVQSCPDEWKFEHFAVSGLTEIGFSELNPDVLLVISGNGRGLFDCSSLKKNERDNTTDFEIDYSNLTCYGIGELKEEKIRISGLHGGGLPLGNSNGDSIEIMALDWPKIDIIFQPKWSSIYAEKDGNKCFRIYSSDTLKTYGFSSNGNYFIIATSSDLLIFKKKYI